VRKLWFDGSARPNPGAVRTAVVAQGRTWLRDDHPAGDNSDAEWLALLDALTIAKQQGWRDVVLIGDSALVVAQASRRAPRMPARFVPYLASFDAAAAGFDRIRVRHVRRAHNLAGAALDR
jgi:ribonuclease HI